MISKHFLQFRKAYYSCANLFKIHQWSLDAMPNVVREPWQKIWQMSSADFGGDRAYLSDFEIYDERAADHQNIILDIYVGINT